VIGHDKHAHGLERNHLKRLEGDRINVLWSGCGFNLRKLLQSLLFCLRTWLSEIGFKLNAEPPRLTGDFTAVGAALFQGR
jgi:hypothetical protein